MVFRKIREALSPQNDEKYEVLYYKYSKIKLDNQHMKAKHVTQMREYKDKTQREIALELIKVFGDIEVAKADSFKVKKITPELQRLLMDVNQVEKSMKQLMTKLSIEEVSATDRFYDPEIHDIASYDSSTGLAKGLIIKTVKKGFKVKGDYIKKPKVVVAK